MKYNEEKMKNGLFHYDMGLDIKTINYCNITHRDAVRAVIINNQQLLMIHSNKGDYKFPGGGIKKGETPKDALKREVREESGYIVKNVGEKIGDINQIKQDAYNRNSIFEMNSAYYLCSITGEKTNQQLDDYEADLEFSPEWISVEDAIQNNEMLLHNLVKDKEGWLERETLVLKKIKLEIPFVSQGL